jgi:anti-sigma regulatory factor (Ser/Thr protein kinase)
MTTAEQQEPVQPTRPPYLITAGAGRLAARVDVTADPGMSVVEVTVRGRWSEHLSAQVAAVLRLCVAGPATAIIVDLHDVHELHGMDVSSWTAAARASRLGPAAVQLALCLPPRTAVDHRSRHADGKAPRTLTTMPEARSAVAGRTGHAHRRLQARLSPQLGAVRAARDLVERACHAWGIPHVREDAALIMSELTANAVEHARTDVLATVFEDGVDLHLAVHDGDIRYPLFGEPASAPAPGRLGERGRGLRLVDAVAEAWGAMPSDGGKVVWATLGCAPRTG